LPGSGFPGRRPHEKSLDEEELLGLRPGIRVQDLQPSPLSRNTYCIRHSTHTPA